IISFIVVISALVQQMEDNHQDFVADSHGSLLSPNASLESPESATEEGVCFACCPCAFDEHSSKILVALTCLSSFSFAGTFVVAGTHACPCNKASVSDKTLHVGSYLRDDCARSRLTDTRDTVCHIQFFTQGDHHGINVLIQLCYLLVQKVYDRKGDLNQEGMMLGKAPFES